MLVSSIKRRASLCVRIFRAAPPRQLLTSLSLSMSDLLSDAIWNKRSVRLVRRVVGKMKHVHVNYLFEAMDAESEDIIRVLLEHGVDPNSGFISLLNIFYVEKYRERNARLLLEYGAHIPMSVLTSNAPIRPFVEAYIYRIWSPVNARDWPVLLRRQIRAILCAVASPRRQLGTPVPSPFLLLYLFQAVAAAHFVYEED